MCLLFLAEPFSFSLLNALGTQNFSGPTTHNSSVRLRESIVCYVSREIEWQPSEPCFLLEAELTSNAERRKCHSKKHEQEETLFHPFLL